MSKVAKVKAALRRVHPRIDWSLLLRWKNAALVLFFMTCMALASILSLVTHITARELLIGAMMSAGGTVLFTLGAVWSVRRERKAADERYDADSIARSLEFYRDNYVPPTSRSLILSPRAHAVLMKHLTGDGEPDEFLSSRIPPDALAQLNGINIHVTRGVPEDKMFLLPADAEIPPFDPERWLKP